MKKLSPVVAVCGILAAAGLVFFAVGYGSNHYLKSKSSVNAMPSVVQCSGTHPAHVVTIQDNHVTPKSTEAKLCETLTITNNDAAVREMAFGEHVDHKAYDGVTEKALDKGQSLSVTLNQAGTFTFHDHFQEDVIGSFTVTK